ncbi:uncharacterized protein LOC103314628 [Tribolium castaneum]|nr:PREDICTED: uncharacterized protein LOC103314628 [Tribolium castaneum]|eukprot:XP_008199314.2 PREDICTED: uncharacterized protein LOC103314628 [Tribolium castaneum]
MESKSLRSYFDTSLKCYHLYGLTTNSSRIRRFFTTYVLYPLMLSLYAMVLYNLRFKHHHIFEFAEVSVSATTFGNILIRKSLVVFSGSLNENVIDKHDQFWKYDSFSKTIAARCYRSMDLCQMLINFIMIGTTISIVVHCSLPLFLKDLLLPQSSWIPGNSSIARIVLYIMEIIVYIECLILMEMFDGLYLLMTVNLKVQFMLLRKAIESINVEKEDDEKCWQKMKDYCKYHKFLLSMHKTINKMYSQFFLYQYLLTIWGTCTTLFVIYNKSSTLAQITESVFIGSIINTLLIIIFIPASEIEIEAEKVAFAIYGIDWYNSKSLRIQKFVLFWLMHAQIPVQMSGAGMLNITRSQMLQIQRIGYSLSTLLSKLS